MIRCSISFENRSDVSRDAFSQRRSRGDDWRSVSRIFRSPRILIPHRNVTICKFTCTARYPTGVVAHKGEEDYVEVVVRANGTVPSVHSFAFPLRKVRAPARVVHIAEDKFRDGPLVSDLARISLTSRHRSIEEKLRRCSRLRFTVTS